MRWRTLLVGSLLVTGCGESSEPPQSAAVEDVAPVAGQPAADKSPAAEEKADTDSSGDAAQASDALVLKARQHFQQGQFGLAIEALGQAISLDAENVAAYVQRAEIYSALREDASALADYSTAIRLQPEESALYNSRGFFLMMRNRLEPAQSDFEKATELDPERIEAWNNHGLVNVARGEFAAGIKDFDRALEISSDYVDALNNRGYALSELGKHEAALKDFDQALEANNQYHNAFNNRGLVHFKLENYEQAVADFTEAIKIQPLELKYYKHRLEAYQKLDHPDKAEADLSQIQWLNALAKLNQRVARAPADPDAYLARYDFYRRGGQLEMAIRDINRALVLTENSSENLLRRAQLWIEMEMYRNAVNDCSAVIKLEPVPLAFSIRGDAYMKLDEHERAIADYEVAKRIDASVAQAYLKHSESLRDQGQDEQATEAYEHAIRLDPTLKRQ